MEEGHFPSRLRRLKRLFKPLPLTNVEIVRVEREEFNQPIALGEGVIRAPAHIEFRIIDLRFPPFLDVVITQHGLE